MGDSRDDFYSTTHSYWSNQDAAPALMGVAPCGAGGLLEAAYRHSEELSRFEKLTRPTKDSRVLELGSGNGRWIVSLAPRVRNYTAVDFSNQMISHARQRVDALGLQNVTFIEASLVDFRTEEKFDIIYISGVSMYLNDCDLEALLLRLRRNLMVTGRLIERATYHRRNEERIDHRSADNYAAIYRTTARLREIFQVAGYRELQSAESYDYFHYHRRFIDILNSSDAMKTIIRFQSIMYPILRITNRTMNYLYGPCGEMQDYTHRFMLFEDDCRGILR